MSYYAKGASPDVAGHYVECSSCSAGGEPFDIQGEMPDRVEYTKARAIEAWNRRTNTNAELVEALREIVDFDAWPPMDFLTTGERGESSIDEMKEIARKALSLYAKGGDER